MCSLTWLLDLCFEELYFIVYFVDDTNCIETFAYRYVSIKKKTLHGINKVSVYFRNCVHSAVSKPTCFPAFGKLFHCGFAKCK